MPIFTEFKDFIHTIIVPHDYKPTNIKVDLESQDYKASSFEVEGKMFLYRQAKVTPKKVGFFVTLWKRETFDSDIAPFHAQDNITGVIIKVMSPSVDSGNAATGFFLFPSTVLVKQGVFSNEIKEGKRGFRVYAPWDNPTSKQAVHTQKWQTAHFMQLDSDNKMTQDTFGKIFDL